MIGGKAVEIISLVSKVQNVIRPRAEGARPDFSNTSETDRDRYRDPGR